MFFLTISAAYSGTEWPRSTDDRWLPVSRSEEESATLISISTDSLSSVERRASVDGSIFALARWLYQRNRTVFIVCHEYFDDDSRDFDDVYVLARAEPSALNRLRAEWDQLGRALSLQEVRALMPSRLPGAKRGRVLRRTPSAVVLRDDGEYIDWVALVRDSQQAVLIRGAGCRNERDAYVVLLPRDSPPQLMAELRQLVRGMNRTQDAPPVRVRQSAFRSESPSLAAARRAYRFALVNGRSPEGEAAILRFRGEAGAEIAGKYARNVVRGCWPEAEAMIRKGAGAWCDYCDLLSKPPEWPRYEGG